MSSPTTSVSTSPSLIGVDPQTTSRPASPRITGAPRVSAPMSESQAFALPPPHVQSLLAQGGSASTQTRSRTPSSGTQELSEQELQQFRLIVGREMAAGVKKVFETKIPQLVDQFTANLQALSDRADKVGQNFDNAGQNFDNAGQNFDNAGQNFEKAGQNFEKVTETFKEVGQKAEEATRVVKGIRTELRKSMDILSKSNAEAESSIAARRARREQRKLDRANQEPNT